MKLRIEVDLNHAAFEDIMEINRILGEIGLHVGSAKRETKSGVCYDIDGYRVGCWEIADDYDQDLNLKVKKFPAK